MGKVIYISRNDGDGSMNNKKEKNNLVELVKLILYFANNSTEKLYKTKLNKLLFYTQFLYYKTYSKRLVSDDFICDYHGPVISELDKYLELFSEYEFIKFQNTKYGTIILPKIVLASNSYKIEERDILKKVLKKFDKYTASAISDYSHNETLWKHTELKSVIDIERAYELNDFEQ